VVVRSVGSLAVEIDEVVGGEHRGPPAANAAEAPHGLGWQPGEDLRHDYLVGQRLSTEVAVRRHVVLRVHGSRSNELAQQRNRRRRGGGGGQHGAGVPRKRGTIPRYGDGTDCRIKILL